MTSDNGFVVIICSSYRRTSIERGARILHDLAPLHVVGFQKSRELLRRAAEAAAALGCELLRDVSRLEDLVALGIDPGNDRRRRSRRCDDSEPGVGVETLVA